jgi:hypothetical protein
MLVVSADHTTDHGARFDRLGDPVLLKVPFFLSAHRGRNYQLFQYC